MTYGVHLIAAVGLSGQIGLDGKVPWHGDPTYAEHTARDLAEFARLTEGGVLLMGSITARTIPLGFKPRGRELVVWNRHMMGAGTAELFLRDIRRTRPQRNIWVCGGEKIYQMFLPFVDWHHISVIPYDGAADRFMPPIIPGWAASNRVTALEDEMDYGDERTRY